MIDSFRGIVGHHFHVVSKSAIVANSFVVATDPIEFAQTLRSISPWEFQELSRRFFLAGQSEECMVF